MSRSAVGSIAGERLRAPAGTPSARLTSPVLVGREQELGLLVEAALSPPAVVVIEGEAGVGKTRLVQELLVRPEVEGQCVLVGYCQPLQEPFPYGPVIDALRSGASVRPSRQLGTIAGALKPLLPELSALPPALEPLGDARAERHRIFRAVAEVLGGLGPAICVLEDVHWSDEGTGDLLRFVVSELPDDLCLVFTYRPEDLPPSSALVDLTSRLPPQIVRRRIRLDPLGPNEVRELVTSILAVDDVSPEFALDLHERTLGLPFAVEEVGHLLAGSRHLVRRDGRRARQLLDELEVPAAVHDFTLGRLALLSPDARQVTRAAAVVEAPASAELLQHVSGLTERRNAHALSEALALGLLRDAAGRFVLRHALAQRVVYEAIEPPERRLLHLKTAEGLEAREDERSLAQVAHHFKHAGRPKRWIRYVEAAADLAISLGNDAAACDLLVEALEYPRISAAARARFAVKLGRAALGSLNHGQAMAVLERILDEDGLPLGLRGEVRLYFGLLLDNQAGQASAGLAEIARAVPELRRRPGLAARAMSALAIPMTMTGHLTEHLEWMNRALDAAERARDPALRTAVLVNRATVLMHAGDTQAWRAVMDVPQHVSSAEEKRQLLRASSNLAHACTCTGHYGPAESFLGRARELLEESSDPYMAVALDSTSVLLDYLRGRWSGLEARADELIRSEQDVPLVVAEVELVLGLLQLARGEIKAAKTHLEAARAVGSTGGSVPVVAAAEGGLARLALARGDAEKASERALAGLELVERKGVWVWAAEIAPVATKALITLGRRAEAVELEAAVSTGLRGRDAPAAKAALCLCRAQVAASAEASEQASRAFRRAERMWASLPRPYEAAQCREARAEVLLSCGAEDEGKELLFTALEELRALDAAWDAARVRRSLREHGVNRPWRGGRKGYGSRLSPREQEVLGLAAQGRTNREIAEALVLSPRTVESHLAKGMRKLGVRSRRALPAKLP
jgi:DNA-binding NarL/FixJ family response regulator